jgi:hypothetical protein
MTTIVNFRIDTALRDAAVARAQKIGLPLALVFRNWLAGFAKGDESVVFSELEEVKLSAPLADRAEQLDAMLIKSMAKKFSSRRRTT